MTIDFADFSKASGAIHLIQGAALLLLGAAEAYAIDNAGRKAGLAAGGALALSGAAMFGVILALPGGWDLGQLSEALAARRGFYLFVAMACVFCAAGLSLITGAALGRQGGGWQAVFLALLAFAGLLYFSLGWRFQDQPREALVWHYAMGATLLLAVAARAADFLLKRRPLRLAWAVLLLATGLQLVTYKEGADTFAPKLITIEATSETPPPAVNDAKPADKKRAAD
jgi:hypothetical protein